jgi:hypothetical protein
MKKHPLSIKSKIPLFSVYHSLNVYFSFHLLNFKTMKKFLFLLACFGLLMAQCHKDNTPQGPTIVEGKILEIDSDVPIANADVFLVEVDATGSIFGPTKNTTIQKMVTDASGNYKFSFQWNKKFTYDVEAQAPTDKYYSDSQSAIFGSDEGKNVQNVYITPTAWLKLHVKNVNPFDSRDEVKFFYGSCYGNTVDSTIVVKVQGSIKALNTIRIWTTRNSVQTYKDISTIVPPHDTTKLDIFY